jgi:hypothetical protein
MNTRSTRSLKVRASIKAGGFSSINHNRAAIRVKTAIKAGGFSCINHNRALVRAR